MNKCTLVCPRWINLCVGWINKVGTYAKIPRFIRDRNEQPVLEGILAHHKLHNRQFSHWNVSQNAIIKILVHLRGNNEMNHTASWEYLRTKAYIIAIKLFSTYYGGFSNTVASFNVMNLNLYYLLYLTNFKIYINKVEVTMLYHMSF